MIIETGIDVTPLEEGPVLFLTILAPPQEMGLRIISLQKNMITYNNPPTPPFL